MAAIDGFDSYSYYESLVNNVIKIQALLRGHLVRKQISQLRHLYDDIVQNIDGQEMEVIWTNSILVHPIVRKCRKTQRVSATLPVNKVNGINEVLENLETITHVSVPENIQILPVLKGQDRSDPQISPKILPSDPEKSSSKQKRNCVSIEVQIDSFELDDCTRKAFTKAEHKMESTQMQCQSLTEVQNVSMGTALHDKSGVEMSKTNCRSVNESCSKSFGGSLPDLPSAPEGETIPLNEVHNKEMLPFDELPILDSHTRVEEEQEKERRKRKVSLADSALYNLPESKEDLQNIKNTLAMELLWVQQAINSRKHYMRLKQGLQ
ncbi:unnamed protein product [Lymnaea stagnalis]|uniref:IQ domain-containing protein C n=1 Tax=Lymnaea stagnalis TaxID=6523 RepID=A0AAV2ILT3_LYMST